MKILAFLQNAWFKNPEKVQAIFDRRPTQRNKLIASFLFAGCLTGRRLREAFGADLCHAIVWEEASPRLAGQSSGVFKPDVIHIQKAIIEHAPDLVLCFGKIAGDAVREMSLAMPVLYGPHPAARQNPMPKLREMAAKIRATS